jgi:hypothetical protein
LFHGPERLGGGFRGYPEHLLGAHAGLRQSWTVGNIGRANPSQPARLGWYPGAVVTGAGWTTSRPLLQGRQPQGNLANARTSRQHFYERAHGPAATRQHSRKP